MQSVWSVRASMSFAGETAPHVRVGRAPASQLFLAAMVDGQRAIGMGGSSLGPCQPLLGNRVRSGHS
jgi:hypothetical protein